MITINIETEQRQDLVRLTELIQESVAANGTDEGICVVYCPHTTGGITLNSQMDPPTLTDLIDEIDRIVPFEPKMLVKLWNRGDFRMTAYPYR